MLTKGFTIFELCVVMLIISILATLSLPSFRFMLDNARADIAQEKVLRLIKLAQRAAVTKNLPVMICKSHTSNACDGSFADGEIVASVASIADESILRVLHVEDHTHGVLYWQSYPRYRHAIMFMPSGLLASDNSTLWYCKAGETQPRFAIFLSQSGRRRVAMPDAQGFIYDSKKHVLKCG